MREWLEEYIGCLVGVVIIALMIGIVISTQGSNGGDAVHDTNTAVASTESNNDNIVENNVAQNVTVNVENNIPEQQVVKTMSDNSVMYIAFAIVGGIAIIVVAILLVKFGGFISKIVFLKIQEDSDKC